MIAEAGAGGFPYLAEGTAPVHKADELVGLRGEAMVAAGKTVLYDKPVLAAIGVLVNLHMTAQTRFERRHPVPGLAEKRFTH